MRVGFMNVTVMERDKTNGKAIDDGCFVAKQGTYTGSGVGELPPLAVSVLHDMLYLSW